jgi:hypothetical protein
LDRFDDPSASPGDWWTTSNHLPVTTDRGACCSPHSGGGAEGIRSRSESPSISERCWCTGMDLMPGWLVGVLVALGALGYFVFRAICNKFIGDEARARADDPPRVILEFTLRRLPEEVREFYRVDWEGQSPCGAARLHRKVSRDAGAQIVRLRLESHALDAANPPRTGRRSAVTCPSCGPDSGHREWVGTRFRRSGAHGPRVAPDVRASVAPDSGDRGF